MPVRIYIYIHIFTNKNNKIYLIHIKVSYWNISDFNIYLNKIYTPRSAYSLFYKSQRHVGLMCRGFDPWNSQKGTIFVHPFNKNKHLFFLLFWNKTTNYVFVYNLSERLPESARFSPWSKSALKALGSTPTPGDTERGKRNGAADALRTRREVSGSGQVQSEEENQPR